MNKLLPLLSLVAYALLAACACPTSLRDPVPGDLSRLQPSSSIGLALYEPKSDVAYLTSSVRHVLKAADAPVATATVHPIREDVLLVEAGSAIASNAGSKHRVSEAAGDEQLDTVYVAWLKYCNNAQDLSTEEWAVIDATNMPRELEKVWAEECISLK